MCIAGSSIALLLTFCSQWKMIPRNKEETFFEITLLLRCKSAIQAASLILEWDINHRKLGPRRPAIRSVQELPPALIAPDNNCHRWQCPFFTSTYLGESEETQQPWNTSVWQHSVDGDWSSRFPISPSNYFLQHALERFPHTVRLSDVQLIKFLLWQRMWNRSVDGDFGIEYWHTVQYMLLAILKIYIYVTVCSDKCFNLYYAMLSSGLQNSFQKHIIVLCQAIYEIFTSKYE